MTYFRLPHPLPLPTWALLGLLSASETLSLALPTPASAHDIYTNLHGKDQQLCCGGSDCALTQYRERADRYEFLTRENTWIPVPQDRITFLPIPGDPPTQDFARAAHLCYRQATDADKAGPGSPNVMGDIYFYCAFIDPGST